MAFHQELNIALILRNSVSLRHWGELFEWPVPAWQTHPVAMVVLAMTGATIVGVCSLLAANGVRNICMLTAGATRPGVGSLRRLAGASGLGGVLGAWVGARYGVSVYAISLLGALGVLVMLAMIDAHTGLLPDLLTLPLLWLGLGLSWSGILPVSLHQSVGGAMAGYGFLWLLSWLFLCIRGKEGMGHGDFKLTAALGAWLGYGLLPVVLLWACCLGLMAVFVRHFLPFGQRTDRVDAGSVLAQTLPFGPYLVLSGASALLVS
ncbi:prepilin peptidase [Neopusillimonas maritima]|uniref:Prepilin type IV endopeptidase peptidase domain-containing protein n=1 Tax=Neopusillimonas maritima TaxID=2026239 RepID=A0A3A1Z1G7_9BURK|nr:A24 family peptidase [Neopusillimonas maritima]RIY42217.1 hypothetical protein CJP73_01900 [Neopusillimonas maritima]